MHLAGLIPAETQREATDLCDLVRLDFNHAGPIQIEGKESNKRVSGNWVSGEVVRTRAQCLRAPGIKYGGTRAQSAFFPSTSRAKLTL